MTSTTRRLRAACRTACCAVAVLAAAGVEHGGVALPLPDGFRADPTPPPGTVAVYRHVAADAAIALVLAPPQGDAADPRSHLAALGDAAAILASGTDPAGAVTWHWTRYRLRFAGRAHIQHHRHATAVIRGTPRHIALTASWPADEDERWRAPLEASLAAARLATPDG